MDNFKYTSQHLGRHKNKHHIVVVGAGIVGVCIAYYLTQHPSFSPETHHVTIIESKRVAGGASGKAGGLLALWAFPQQIVPLSFQLHRELSEQYGGDTAWDYRGLTTVSLEGDIQQALKEDELDAELEASSNVSTVLSEATDLSSTDERAAETKNKLVLKNLIPHEHSETAVTHLPRDLDWIAGDTISDWSLLGKHDTTAQVHPYKFTNFILKKAIETGAVELIIGKVSELVFSEETGEAEGVVYIPSTAQDEANGTNLPVRLDAHQIVLLVGPWTLKLLPDCPILGLRAHLITVLPEGGMVSPYAIFLELRILKNAFVLPEMYARKDEVYVCGEGDTAVDVPETTDDVEVVREKCDKLFHYVGKLLPNLRRGRILKRQACYLPVLDVPSSSGPLIGETNVPRLYLASGHSCWGINNAPGTGKVMAELLLEGEAVSADISALDPGLYFDASVWE